MKYRGIQKQFRLYIPTWIFINYRFFLKSISIPELAKIMDFFFYSVIKIILLIYVFWPVESKSDVHFRWAEPVTLDNMEKHKKKRIVRSFQYRPAKMDTRFGFYRSK